MRQGTLWVRSESASGGQGGGRVPRYLVNPEHDKKRHLRLELVHKLTVIDPLRQGWHLLYLNSRFPRPAGRGETDMESFLETIRNPDVAYLFLMLAILGIGVEILTPGVGVPSVLGTFFGILAFLALVALPVNPLGIVLILLSLAFFVAEAIRRPRGLFILIGMASLAIGSFFLYHNGLHPSYLAIALITVAMTIILVYVSNRVVVTMRKRAVTGREELIGKTVRVRTPLRPQGTVSLEGEIWTAILDQGTAQPGETVTVTGLKGLTLYVTKKEGGS